jgi:hypothetical protein
MTTEIIEPNDKDFSAANIADEVLRVVAQHDDRTAPRALLDAARDPASPLHACFVWDNELAGERYRLAQAAGLYRRVKLQIVRADPERREVIFETVRAVTSVPAERSKANSNSYGRTSVVMDDDKRRASVLRGIVRDLVALRNKYAKYAELHDVWVVIDDAALMFDPPSVGKRRRDSAPPPAA